MNIAIIILLIILLIIGLMNLAVLLSAARKRKNVGEPFRMNDDNNSEWFIKFNESKGDILEKINLLTTGNRDSLDKINDTLNNKISGFQKDVLINLILFHPLLENLLRIIALNPMLTLRN